MGQVIAVVSGKGGTGKTSFVSHVGLYLANMGKKVLCLDCDIGLRNLDIALGMSDCMVMDFTDVLEGRCSLEEAITPHPRVPTLSLLTAPNTLRRPVDSAAFQRMLSQIRRQFDYCLIDAAAGLGAGFRLAVAGCDRAIVVTTTDPTSLRDAQRTVMELGRLPRGRVHLVVNRCKRRLMRSLHQTIDDAIDTAGLPLLGVVPEDEALTLAMGRGIPLPFLGSDRYAGRAYRNIAARITGTRVPLMRIH